MKDEEKRYVFTGSVRDYALLRIRLRYDSLTQSEFFRMLVRKYIEKDLKMLEVVEDFKTERAKMGIKKIKRSTEEIKKSHEILAEAGFGKAEKENIFDLIESNVWWVEEDE